MINEKSKSISIRQKNNHTYIKRAVPPIYMKRTKILATLGPAVNNQQAITALIQAGANGLRINLSHGNQEQWMGLIKQARQANDDIPVIADTKGPELRILNVAQERELSSADTLTFSTQPHEDLPYLSQEVQLSVDDELLIDDGNISATVIDISDDAVTVKITHGGHFSNKRKITVPNTKDHLPILTKEDKEDLQALKEHIDGVAVSFTRTAQDIKTVRELVGDECMLIAKIENQEGVDHIDEIIQASDAIMVARGDLGVEVPLEEVPLIQKRIIQACIKKAKPCIVATQMLESMIAHNKPTRAEASDVANAILDGADCVMLSGETAMGDYPIEAVKTMSNIAQRIETELHTTLPRVGNGRLKIAHAISNAVYDLSLNLEADAILTSTASGFTTRMVARFRPQTVLIGVAHSQHVKRRLQLSWGVTPILFLDADHHGHKTIHQAVRSALQHELIKENSLVIATAGVDTMQHGSTNLIEVHEVTDLLKYHDNKH